MKRTFEEQLERCRQIMLHDTCPLTDEDIDRIILSAMQSPASGPSPLHRRRCILFYSKAAAMLLVLVFTLSLTLPPQNNNGVESTNLIVAIKAPSTISKMLQS